MLRVRSLRAGYGGVEVLKGVSLHVDPGEIVAIVDSSHKVRPGDSVQLRLPVEKLHLFNLETGDKLASSAA